jgi:hypothetical protein
MVRRSGQSVIAFVVFFLACPVQAALTAQDVVQLARQQLSLPAEVAQGEMTVFRNETVKRACSFVLGKLWDQVEQTEAVRIDFKTAVNSIGDSALYSDQRYLLKRTGQEAAAQWLYLPALRRVRIVPFQPNDPLLQSHMLFYDLTPIVNFGDYRYRFLDANEQAPVVEGTPAESANSTPYQSIVFYLQKRGSTYLVTTTQAVVDGKEKIARFSAFREIAPNYYRPEQVEISEDDGRTEFTFSHWIARPLEPQLLTPTHLETQTLGMPASEEQGAH